MRRQSDQSSNLRTFEQALCKGVQPSASCAWTSASFETRYCTIRRRPCSEALCREVWSGVGHSSGGIANDTLYLSFLVLQIRNCSTALDYCAIRQGRGLKRSGESYAIGQYRDSLDLRKHGVQSAQCARMRHSQGRKVQ